MRRPSPVALVVGLLLAAACTADPPSAPPSGLRPSRAVSIPYPTTCSPNVIRQTMASLYKTTDLKSFALPAFNKAQSDQQAGNTTAARAGYFAVVDHLLDTFRDDRLQQPSQLASVQDGVFYLVAGVLNCAGDGEVADLATFITGIGNDAPNYQVCVVLLNPDGTYRSPLTEPPDPNGRIECVAPSKGAALKLDQFYLTKEALILIDPDLADAYDGYFAADLGTTWSDVWRIRIAPLDAQANYGVASPPATAPKGHAAVCTVDKFETTHNHLTHEERMRLGYSAGASTTATLLSPSDVATGLLEECTDYVPVWDDGVGTSAIGAVPVLESWHARVLARGLREAGSRAARLFTPATLHAFDGGIGGGLFSMASYFAATEDPAVYIRKDPSTETQGPVPTLSIPQQGTQTVLASRTSYGITLSAGSCSWISSHNRVTVTPNPANGAYATLTTGRSSGTAVVTATCTRNAVSASYATTVTVTR